MLACRQAKLRFRCTASKQVQELNIGEKAIGGAGYWILPGVSNSFLINSLDDYMNYHTSDNSLRV